MSFSQRLEQSILKKYKNISQFADDIGISHSLVRAYIKELSAPTAIRIKEMADFLSVSPAWLAYGIDDSSVSENKENEIIDAVNLINRRLDLWLKENKKKMHLNKKSILVKIIYKKLQLNEMKNLSEDKLNESIGDLIEFYSAA